MIRRQGPGAGRGSGQVWRVDMKDVGGEGETGKGAMGRGRLGGATGRGRRGGRDGERGNGRRRWRGGNGEEDDWEDGIGEGRWGRVNGEGAVGREGERWGQAHRMPGWHEVTIFLTLFTRATPGTPASI